MTFVDSAAQIGGKPQDPRPRSSGSIAQDSEASKPEARLSPRASQTFRDVDAWLTLYKKRPGKWTVKPDEISSVISSFDVFCKEYLSELSKLLETKTPRNWLENAVDNTLLDYWEPILRAAEQSRATHYRPLLEKAYIKLGLMQQNLEQRLSFKFDVNVVLYFDRVGKAKRYPFGKMYLIGVPLIDAYRGDWMAIPHELGHHVYWKTRFAENDDGPVPVPGTNFLQDEIENALQQLALSTDTPARDLIRRLLNDWTEEIFADVVGARVAGKEFVEAAWDRISRQAREKDDLFKSDAEHPILYLLPYIRAAAAEIPFEDRWASLSFEVKETQLEPHHFQKEKPQEPTIRIADLKCAVEALAANITARLKKSKLDELLENPSSIEELKHYIRSVRKDAGSKLYTIDDDNRILESLLKPAILEKGAEWTCKNGHTNSSANNPCPTCGEPRYVLWFFPVP